MYTILYQYLILHKHLSLPGIGSIHLQKTSSEFDFGNKCFTAPAYNFKVESGQQSPSKKLFEWLSKIKEVTEWEAIKLVNDFSFNLKNQISAAGELNWENVGRFLRDEKGNIVLESAFLQLESEMPVVAEKVIREKAEHKVMVGDSERTAIEMEEYFSDTPAKKDFGWIIAIVVVVLSIMMLGIYLSEKGLNPSSVGNQNIIQTR